MKCPFDEMFIINVFKEYVVTLKYWRLKKKTEKNPGNKMNNQYDYNDVIKTITNT